MEFRMIKWVLVLIVASNSAYSGVRSQSGVTYVPWFLAGVYNIKYKSDYFGDVDVLDAGYTVGLTTSKDNYGFTISYFSSTGSDKDAPNAIFGKAQAPRDELDFSLKVSLDDNVSVFTGYLISDFSVKTRELLPNLGRAGIYKQKWDEKGLYFGAGYQKLFKYGNLSFHIAYTNLANDISEHPNLLGGKINGQTNGFSYGFKWISAVGENWGYNVGTVIRQYKVESVNSADDVALPAIGVLKEDAFDADWNALYVNVGLYYSL